MSAPSHLTVAAQLDQRIRALETQLTARIQQMRYGLRRGASGFEHSLLLGIPPEAFHVHTRQRVRATREQIEALVGREIEEADALLAERTQLEAEAKGRLERLQAEDEKISSDPALEAGAPRGLRPFMAINLSVTVSSAPIALSLEGILNVGHVQSWVAIAAGIAAAVSGIIAGHLFAGEWRKEGRRFWRDPRFLLSAALIILAPIAGGLWASLHAAPVKASIALGLTCSLTAALDATIWFGERAYRRARALEERRAAIASESAEASETHDLCAREAADLKAWRAALQKLLTHSLAECDAIAEETIASYEARFHAPPPSRPTLELVE